MSKPSSGPQSVCIFGAGSIGLYLGGRLASAGVHVNFIGRERFGSILREQGLKLTHFAKEPLTLSLDQFTFTSGAKETEQALAATDVVLVCVKSQDTAAAARDLAGSVRADALIVSFQNGVSNASVLRDGLGHVLMDGGAVVGAVVPFNVTQTGANSWHSGTDGALTVEQSAHPALLPLVMAFQDAEQAIAVSEDILGVQWGKLLVNLNNGLNTLWGGTLKSGLMQRDYRRAFVMQIEEATTLLQRENIHPAAFGGVSLEKMLKIMRLPNIFYGFIMQKIVKMDGSARSSMLDDLEAGKACEIDYLQGEVVRLAKSQGQTAPINQAVMDAVQSAFAAGTSPKLDGAKILKLMKAAKTS